MPHDVRKYLVDIKLHIDYIDTFLGGKRDFTAYENDLATQYAVERALGIIGEAANKIRKVASYSSISSLNQIIAVRNILIHAYDSVDNAIIWSVIINHLPILKEEINELLAALS